MLIGFTGRAGVGKTTIAKMFEERQGYTRKAFADPLKESLSVMTGLSMMHFTSPHLKEVMQPFGKTPRQLMQLFGTEFVRTMVHKDFWVIRMRQRLTDLGQGSQFIVLDDCRFENETTLVRDMGGVVVHLQRAFPHITKEVDHASEKPVRIYSTDIVIDSGINFEEFTYDAVCRHLAEARK